MIWNLKRESEATKCLQNDNFDFLDIIAKALWSIILSSIIGWLNVSCNFTTV